MAAKIVTTLKANWKGRKGSRDGRSRKTSRITVVVTIGVVLMIALVAAVAFVVARGGDFFGLEMAQRAGSEDLEELRAKLSDPETKGAIGLNQSSTWNSQQVVTESNPETYKAQDQKSRLGKLPFDQPRIRVPSQNARRYHGSRRLKRHLNVKLKPTPDPDWLQGQVT